MRKATTLETGKIITMIILLMGTCISASAQSPYAMFGDNSKMLEAKSEPVNSIYRVLIKTDEENRYFADFDFKKGIATLSDMAGNIVLQDSISENAKAMFTTIDPMAENYYHLSPYAYCANNPTRFKDPTGMIIEEGSLAEWDRQKALIESERNRLESSINRLLTKAELKGWSSEKLSAKIGNRLERVENLNSSIGTMGVLENSSQVYSLAHANGIGGLSFDSNTAIISINFAGTANFVHEMTHAGQFESGDIAFMGSGTALQDIYDEVAAYKAQFAYDPSSISMLTSTSCANSFGTITPLWVQGLQYGTGNTIYAPGGMANTGIVPVNINATRDVLIQAYPWNAAYFQTLPIGYSVQNQHGLYYKRK